MKKIATVLICLLIIPFSKAQERVITTGVPFLLVAGDARAAGMADNGVATSADVYSQQWNPAKYAFSLDKQGFSVSYTPYLVELVMALSFTHYSQQSQLESLHEYTFDPSAKSEKHTSH